MYEVISSPDKGFLAIVSELVSPYTLLKYSVAVRSLFRSAARCMHTCMVFSFD